MTREQANCTEGPTPPFSLATPICFDLKRIGNVGRDSFIGPGFFQSDIGLAKGSVSRNVLLCVSEVDAINAFNKVNLGSPNTCVDCSNGGTITSLTLGATQRRLRVSLRVEF